MQSSFSEFNTLSAVKNILVFINVTCESLMGKSVERSRRDLLWDDILSVVTKKNVENFRNLNSGKWMKFTSDGGKVNI
jgi:hypothetical protein